MNYSQIMSPPSPFALKSGGVMTPPAPMGAPPLIIIIQNQLRYLLVAVVVSDIGDFLWLKTWGLLQVFILK